MIYPLEKTDYKIVRKLFHTLQQTQPMVSAVLEGIYPGNIYVNNVSQPETAVLITFIESEAHGAWAFLAGDPGIGTFNIDLNRAIFDRQVISHQTPVVLFTCESLAWDSHIPNVMAPIQPIRVPRWHFICREIKFHWKDVFPSGYTLKPISRELQQLSDLEIPEDVRITIDKWNTISDDRFKDYGFVILDETGQKPVITCWATVDFITDGFGDLGFFTQPSYRRRGIGTIVVAATLEYGFTKGLRQVNWTCDADNQGSLRTAQKLGLERLEDYIMYVLVFDRQ
jgi:RimJ/RimL family protein N-acetyltransferase